MAEEVSWEDVPEYDEGNRQQSVPVEDIEQSETEEEYEEPDSEEEPQEEEEEETQEEEVDWEDRYKNLEASHSRRGNEVHSLKQEKESLRLEKIEIRQQLQEMSDMQEKLKQFEIKAKEEPDPFDDERYWSDEEREILREYPEVMAVANKIAKRESARSLKGFAPKDESSKEEIEELRNSVSELGDYISRQQMFAELDKLVGTVWKDIDNDPKFYDFVNESKIRYRAMDTGDLEEKAEVFNAYLETQVGQKRHLPQQEEPSPTPRQNQRRQAAQGLVKGSASRASKPQGELTGDALWDSIPDPE